jgi:hypothetical protein
MGLVKSSAYIRSDSDGVARNLGIQRETEKGSENVYCDSCGFSGFYLSNASKCPYRSDADCLWRTRFDPNAAG